MRLISPTVSVQPSTVSLPVSLDFVSVMRRQGDAQTLLWCQSQQRLEEAPPVRQPQELEMQERRRPVEEGKSSTEHISFIDEEEPAE